MTTTATVAQLPTHLGLISSSAVLRLLRWRNLHVNKHSIMRCFRFEGDFPHIKLGEVPLSRYVVVSCAGTAVDLIFVLVG